METNFQEFKEYMLSWQSRGISFHLYKNGLIINARVTGVDVEKYSSGVEFTFEGGRVTIWNDNLIKKQRRPGNLIPSTPMEVCYSLYNEDKENIGYVYNY